MLTGESFDHDHNNLIKRLLCFLVNDFHQIIVFITILIWVLIVWPFAFENYCSTIQMVNKPILK